MESDPKLEIIKAYISSAESFVKLSTGGLVLPIALKSQVFGLFGLTGTLPPVARVLVCASWLMFLTTIASGVLYEYSAVKWLEYRSDPTSTYVPRLLTYLIVEGGPGVAYGIMAVTFYVGAVTVVLYSAYALFA